MREIVRYAENSRICTMQEIIGNEGNSRICRK